MQIAKQILRTSRQTRKSTSSEILCITRRDTQLFFLNTHPTEAALHPRPASRQKLDGSTWRSTETRERNPLPGAINTPTFELPPSAERLSIMKRFEERSKPFPHLDQAAVFFSRASAAEVAVSTPLSGEAQALCAVFVQILSPDPHRGRLPTSLMRLLYRLSGYLLPPQHRRSCASRHRQWTPGPPCRHRP
jgi:hypothetical protein